MQKGSIRVQTENIFPIIKKFLYSDHEIFLRELISNAVDASQKLKTLSSIGEAKGEIGDLSITVKLDKEAKTITISDKGIGMTAEEVDKYLNQVALSGAEEFVNKYKGQNENAIIGKFGLGFYSAFMVSNKVEVITKSFKEDQPAVRWECDGSPEYTLEEDPKTERGTDIILHIQKTQPNFWMNIEYTASWKNFVAFCLSRYFLKKNKSIIHVLPGRENPANSARRITRIFIKNYILSMNRPYSGFI